MHAFRLAEAALNDCGPGVTLLELQGFTQVPGLLEGHQSVESDAEVVAQTPLQGNGEGLLQNQLLERQTLLVGWTWQHEPDCKAWRTGSTAVTSSGKPFTVLTTGLPLPPGQMSPAALTNVSWKMVSGVFISLRAVVCPSPTA